MINQGHHNEFDVSKISVNELQKELIIGYTYNHKADKTASDKYSFEHKLKKIGDDTPRVFSQNKDKYQNGLSNSKFNLFLTKYFYFQFYLLFENFYRYNHIKLDFLSLLVETIYL